jgi:hypothetical protein
MAILALPAVAVAAVGAVIETSIGGDGGGGGARAAAPAAAGTAVVSRRTLVDRQRVDGTLGYSGSRAATNRLSGTITWLPHTGQIIRPGGTLFEVDGDPVVLMDGTLPAYRTLRAGMSDGRDVRELERGLARLGFDPGTVDDHYDATTAAAVRAWQGDRGLQKTGSVELGRVVFLPGARRVTDVKVSLGSAAGGGGNGDGSASNIAWRPAVPRTTFVSLTTPDDTSTTTTPEPTPTTPANSGGTSSDGSDGGQSHGDGAKNDGSKKDGSKKDGSTSEGSRGKCPTGNDSTGNKPTGNKPTGNKPTGNKPTGNKPTGSSPTGDGSNPSGSNGGDTNSPATDVLMTSSTRRVVTAKLDAADQTIAARGRRVRVELPTGRVVAGRIVHVGTVATTDSSGADAGGGSTTIPITIRLRSARAAGRLDQAPVSVQIARTTRRNVLAVPVQALVARAGGRYAVELADGRLVDVTPGMFADGFVELAGGAIRAGDRVRVPR